MLIQNIVLQLKNFKLKGNINCFKIVHSVCVKCFVWIRQKKQEFLIISFNFSKVEINFNVLYFLINIGFNNLYKRANNET